MQNDILLLFRIVFTGLFLLTLLAGVYLGVNYQKLFGVDRNMPSETGSSRAYSKVQIFSVWPTRCASPAPSRCCSTEEQAIANAAFPHCFRTFGGLRFDKR